MDTDRRDLLKLSGCLVATGALAPRVSASSHDWPMPRYGSANTAAGGEGPADGVETDWTSQTGVVGTPVVAEGNVYVVDSSGGVSAVDAGSGEGVWTFDANGTTNAPASYADGFVYVTSGGVTYSLDAETGEEEWSQRATGISRASPKAVGDTVYAGVGSTLYAYGFHTGTVLWQYDATGPLRGIAVSDGTVYAASGDGTVHAVGADEGSFEWRSETGSTTAAAPVVADGSVFTVSERGEVRSFGVSRGDQDWSVSLLSSVGSPPAVDGDHVYVPTDDGSVHALRTSSGWEEWVFEADGAETAPAVRGDTVYVGFGGTLYALDSANKDEIWSHDGPTASPAVTDDAVYMGDAALYSLTAAGSSAQTAVVAASVGATASETGEDVEVTAEVENSGDAEGTHEATLYVDGSEEDTRSVTVPAEGTRELRFSTRFEEAGEYSLTVDDTEAGTVEVTEATAPDRDNDTSADDGATNSSETSDDGAALPGFGAPVAVAAAGAVAAKRLLSSDKDS